MQDIEQEGEMLTVNIYENDGNSAEEEEEEKKNYLSISTRVPKASTPVRREATHIRRPSSILKGSSTAKN